MPAAQPPPPWIAPVSPIVVKRRFRVVAPYSAGGHRGIDLGVSPGRRVGAPCAGRVAFRGRVAGGPQTVTIDCGALRATLQRLEPAGGVVKGRWVGRGDRVGVATATAVDLSARLLDGTYLDPLPLLAEARPRRVPPVVPRPERPTRTGAGAPQPSVRAQQPEPVDWPLAIGAAMAVLAASLTGLRATRRSPGRWRRAGRLPIPALVARDRR